MNKERAKNVDRKMFDCIKILLAGGASAREIEEYTNVGRTTVCRIRNSENWEDYQNQLVAMRMAYHAKYNAKKKENERKAAEKAAEEKAAAEKAELAKKAAESVNAVPASTLVPNQPEKAAPKVDPVYGANRICELLTHQNELLKGIMNKLAFIVDELTGIPSPKGGDPA